VRAQEQVDLLLVLASDVSRSVDTRKFELQRQGYAAALSNPRVIDAIRSGPHGKIAICFVEWSGQTSQKLLIDWIWSTTRRRARKIIDQMLEFARTFADRTAISAGIDFAVSQLERAPFKAYAPAPSMYQATAPTIPAATSVRRATTRSRKASRSTVW